MPVPPFGFPSLLAAVRRTSRLGAVAAVCALGLVIPRSAACRDAHPDGSYEKDTDGRPTVVLDRLVFQLPVAGKTELEHHLRQVLGREARSADWGAGRDNRIEYRFFVETLEVQKRGNAIVVRCVALGQLPGGQRARSEITFGGAPVERPELMRRVLSVAARGVIARLAELERNRRGLR